MATWVVHEGSFAIGFFDLVLGGVLANSKHLVVIFPLAFLQLQLCHLQQLLVIYGKKIQVRQHECEHHQ